MKISFERITSAKLGVVAEVETARYVTKTGRGVLRKRRNGKWIYQPGTQEVTADELRAIAKHLDKINGVPPAPVFSVPEKMYGDIPIVSEHSEPLQSVATDIEIHTGMNANQPTLDVRRELNAEWLLHTLSLAQAKSPLTRVLCTTAQHKWLVNNGLLKNDGTFETVPATPRQLEGWQMGFAAAFTNADTGSYKGQFYTWPASLIEAPPSDVMDQLLAATPLEAAVRFLIRYKPFDGKELRIADTRDLEAFYESGLYKAVTYPGHTA